MKKKRAITDYSLQFLPDTSIPNKAIHIIVVEGKTWRIYSNALKSLGTFKSLRSAVAAAKRTKKYQRMTIVVHDSDGDVLKTIRPKITGIDTSERTTIKTKTRPSRTSALAI